ncbi:MAG: hypothetical protein ACD_41C00330G0006 [uncultured bacterium]|nr:MAG: hypothetical protein ACD_41C00330G0006 [uncultured bacterium]
MMIKSATFVKGVVGTDAVLDELYPQIAFIGRSNSGKSSLINSLTNQKGLARTSSFPGRTQEINLFFINRNTYFLDLPGYGYAKVSKDSRRWLQKVIQWYLFKSDYQQKVIVLVLDTNIGPTDRDLAMIQQLEEHDKNFIIIANKVDKIRQPDYPKQLAHIQATVGDRLVIPFSTKTRQGIQDVLEIVLDCDAFRKN